MPVIYQSPQKFENPNIMCIPILSAPLALPKGATKG